MSTESTGAASADYDPWPQPSVDPKEREISGEPSYWHRINPRPRARLWGCTVAIKQQPPSRSKNVQERVREMLLRQRDAGDDVALQLLDAVRDLWNGGTDAIGDLSKRIDKAAGAIAFLTSQREEIDRQIVKLRALTSGAAEHQHAS